MNKMRESLKKHLTDPQWEIEETSAVSFSAGYQAAIADVKAGGPEAWQSPNSHYLLEYFKAFPDWTPLYKLPEDV